MAYLLDSDWLIDLLGEDKGALELLDRLSSDGMSVSVVSYMETFQGTLRTLDPAATQARFEILIDAVSVLPFTAAEARRCARIRESFRERGHRVNAWARDSMIAATAIEHDLTLVTRNTRDYRAVPGLNLYDHPL